MAYICITDSSLYCVLLSAAVSAGVDISGERPCDGAPSRPIGGGHNTSLQLSGGFHPGGQKQHTVH